MAHRRTRESRCLAAARLDAPLLLADTSLPLETLDELHRLHLDNIYILGGTSAVPASVDTALGAYGTTHLLAPTDRYVTAVAISQFSFPTTASVVPARRETGVKR